MAMSRALRAVRDVDFALQLYSFAQSGACRSDAVDAPQLHPGVPAPSLALSAKGDMSPPLVTHRQV